MEKIKIALVGYRGKMGSVAMQKLKDDYEILGVGRNEQIVVGVDLVVDFASAESSMESLVWCKTNKVPLVIGSTGQSGTQMKEIENASKSIAIFKAGNFSVGINNLKNALESLITNDAQEITIFEKHHKNKKDAPSGTAKEIAEYIGKKFNKPVNIIFERGGKEIGTHSVDIYYENEVVSISHKVFSRDAFADGVRKAVDFMIGCKVAGLYSMEDIKF